MAKNTTVFNYGGAFDKNGDGEFRDTRKAEKFLVASDELTKKTELAGLRKTIFADRYSMKGDRGESLEEYPEQMWRRIASGIAQFEPTLKLQKEWSGKFESLMQDFKFVPAGRILSGAGTGYEVTFFNCYVLPSPADSRGGIMENITQTVEIQARAGGVGINLSSLRPRGARVKKVNGTSSGPVNWANLYSSANHDVIQQGGSRRGALMLMLADWHPDVTEFIKVKEDLSKIPGANLSVTVSDKFMDAVKSDSDWDLVFPDLGDPEYDEVWNGDLDKWRSLGKKVEVYRTVKARKIWDEIAQAAWNSAEPGVVFLERYNKMSNTWYFERIECVNPCVTGDTLVSTDRGLQRIEDVVGKDVNVLVDGRLDKDSGSRFKKAGCVIKTGKKDVYRLSTKEGYELKLTADHKVMTNRGWVEASKLEKDDKLFLANRVGAFGTEGSAELGKVVGWLVGDGTFSGVEAVLSFFGEEKYELASDFASMVTGLVADETRVDRTYNVSVVDIKGRDEQRVSSTRLGRIVSNLGLIRGDKLKVPEVVFGGSREMQKGFLQALFTADGHVAGKVGKGLSVRLTSVNYRLLQDVGRLLLNFGIMSKIYKFRRKAQSRMLPDGHGGLSFYNCHEYHDLVISKINLARFAQEIAFLTTTKNMKLEEGLAAYGKRGSYRENFLARFESLEYLGQEWVYDLTEPLTHSFVANGLVVHNCGEQGLPAWGVCNLGSMNLAAYVRDDGFDYQSLEKDVAVAMRFMDNVVDANFYFYEENRKAQMEVRRTGLGTMGLADALIKLKVKYGSEESLEVIEKIYKTIRDGAYRASVDLAEEKGAFPKFEKDKYLQGEFIKRLPEDIKDGIGKHGIRNGVILTQAPTGTTSLLAGVSSGMEPNYDFAYKRTDRTGEHILYHPLYEEWLKDHEGEDRPDYFVTAKELTPEEHVKVQAKVQEFTDSSISKTVNAPNSYTVDDVRKLYNMAYDLGCKGVTFFRDGSRQGVLESVGKKDDKKKEEKSEEAEEVATLRVRPKQLTGKTYEVATPVGNAFITINSDEEGRPFEVFTNVGKAGSHLMADAEALGRLVSLSLRIPSKLAPRAIAEAIVDQLAGIGGADSIGFGNGRVRSLADGVAKTIRAHLEGQGEQKELTNGHAKESPLLSEKPTGSLPVDEVYAHQEALPLTSKKRDLCPDCGQATLVMEEGCMKCYSCGASKC